MLETRPERPQGFYRLERVGRIEMGIGSALEPKTLARIAGPTEAPNDDLILEIRITSTDVDPCVSRPPNGGSLHVSLLGTLLGARLPDVFGFMPQQGDRRRPSCGCSPGIAATAISPPPTCRARPSLNELAADAGRQLAGHFWTTFPEPLRGHLRFAQLRAFELSQVRARAAARRYADETIRGWEAFKQQP